MVLTKPTEGNKSIPLNTFQSMKKLKKKKVKPVQLQREEDENREQCEKIIFNIFKSL